MGVKTNNTGSNSARRCSCGRYITNAEVKAGLGVISYECPTCFNYRHTKPVSSENWYKNFYSFFEAKEA